MHPKAIDLSLDRVRRLMADLGDPQDRLPPTIHVAGTNGKGSTLAFLRAILEAAGARVHVYTSPHLVRFNERIRLAGRLIGEDDLAAVLEEVERVNAGRPITFFEVTTAAAFVAFARTQADAVLLEVGMGGRLDATNLVRRPTVSAIAPVSFDHMQYLGRSLGEIAGEKAGILKQDVTAAIAPQAPEAAEAIARQARTVGAPLYRYGAEWRITPTPKGFRYDGRRALDLPMPALPGRHQCDNAGLALAVLENFAAIATSAAHIREGLTQVEWPARLQRLHRGPLVARLPKNSELFLDGGHNDAAGEALADWASRIADDKPLDLVFGMLSTKTPGSFLGPLKPHVRRVVAVTIPDEPLALPAEDVAAAARARGFSDVATASSVEAAIAGLARRAAGPVRILICGSLYLAGRVLADNG